MIKKTLFYTFIFSLIAAAILISPLIIGFGKTGKNTFVLNKDYSLLSKANITSRVATDFKLPDSFALAGPDRQYILMLSSISAQVDANQVANNVYILAK